MATDNKSNKSNTTSSTTPNTTPAPTNDKPVVNEPVQQQITTEQTAPATAPKEEEKIYDVPEMFKNLKTKSAVIRQLSADGLKVAQIHKILKLAGVKASSGEPIRYQHVRNVLAQTTKKVS